MNCLAQGDGKTGAPENGKEQLESRDVESDSGDGHGAIMFVKYNLLFYRPE